MHSFILGQTASGLPILAHQFGTSGPEVLILGGVHGDEPEGAAAALGLVQRWIQTGFSFQLRVTVVPQFNLDGVISSNRLNFRGVDLNRNMATKDWSPAIATPRYNPGPKANSEPETLALIAWLDVHKPVFVLSLHSWHPVLNVNGDCEAEAQAIAGLTGYKVDTSIGYPTPGCLGTYCGLERAMPTLTYEIERGLATPEILRVHLPAIEEGLKVTETKRRKVV